MPAPTPRVRIGSLLGVIIAAATLLVPAPRPASAANTTYGTLLVPGAQWAGQYASLGDLNVYDNGAGNQDINSGYGLQYECVELAQRWAALRYHEQRLWPIGRAAQMWGAAPNLLVPMQQIPNGSAPPQFGDLVIFDATSYDPSGHVAIVADTGPGYVDLVEQNWNHIGFNRVPMSSSTTMPARWGLNPLGWLRGPGGSKAPVIVSGSYAGAFRKGGLVALDNSAWGSTTGDAGFPFRHLSGKVTASLAVVQYPGSNGVDRGTGLYIGTFADQRLWARTDSSPWRLVSASQRCLDNPAAVLTPDGGGGDRLIIGCQGTDHHLWTISGPVTRGSAPTFPGSWTNLGGLLSAGPAMATVNGVPSVVVTGSDHRLRMRPLIGGAWTGPLTGLSCTSHPALATWNNQSWVGCHQLNGTAGYAWSSGGGWSQPATARTQLMLDGPALTSTPTGQAILDVTGPDHQVWESTLSTAGAGQFSARGWQVNQGPSFSAAPYPSLVVATMNPRGGALQVNRPQSGTTTLGGTLDGTVAAVAVPGGTAFSPTHALYFGTFTDHRLRVRSDTLGWALLTSSRGPTCTDSPGAAVVGGRLTVACMGTDHQLWYASGTVPGTGLPSLRGWSALGGTLTAGPAVGAVNGMVTFLVTSRANQALSRTATQPWAPFLNLRCQGHPAIASAGALTYAACTGTDGQLWYSTANAGSWAAPQTVAGRMVDGPGIAGFADRAIVAVQGTDGNVYETSVGRGQVPSAWVRIPLTATRGAAATSL